MNNTYNVIFKKKKLFEKFRMKNYLQKYYGLEAKAFNKRNDGVFNAEDKCLIKFGDGTIRVIFYTGSTEKNMRNFERKTNKLLNDKFKNDEFIITKNII